jgi:transcriptional regulator with GAF, ATPase, and Fis domain
VKRADWAAKRAASRPRTYRAKPSGPGTLYHVQRTHVLATLQAHAGNKTATARALGCTYRGLMYMLARYEERP